MTPSAQPLVSIVITSYNYGKFLGRAIESALEQHYPDLEVVVCENGSTDNSFEVIARYQSDPRLRLVVNETNLGMLGNLNKGIAESKGEFIVFLSADDYFLPGHISRAVQYYQDNPQVDVVYSPALVTDEEGRFTRTLQQRGYPKYGAVWGRNEFVNLLVYDSFMCFPTMLLRRSLFDEFGLLEEDLHIATDYEFVIRIAAGGKTFGFLNEARVVVRFHSNNRSSIASYVASGEQMRDYLSILERYIVPENYGLATGFGAAIELLLDTRISDVGPHSIAAPLLAELEPRIAAVRERLKQIPTLGDPQAHCAKPLVSVVVPTIGEVGLLTYALESIASQEYGNWEVLLVSDGGTDLSGYVAALPFSDRVRYVHTSASGGAAQARNHALDLARGDVIAYLDEDNLYKAQYLGRVIRAFEDPQVMLTRANADLVIENFDPRISAERTVIERFEGAFDGPSQGWVSLVNNDTPLNCIAHRRMCTVAIGTFDETLALLEDWQFLLRLSSHFAAVKIGESLVDIRWDRMMKHNFSLRNWKAYLPTLQRLYAAYATDPVIGARRQTFLERIVTRVQALEASGHGVQEAIALIEAISGSHRLALAGA